MVTAIEVIFPKVRAEILRLLFADPSRQFHLRDLSRHAGLALRTIQQEVSKLAQAELLVARRDGNRLYYRANTAHPIFSDLQGIALKTTGLREQLAAALEGLPGLELAFVFGSSASGHTVAGSDVDLLVVGPVGLRALAPRLRPLTSSLGREVNPHVLTQRTLATKVRSGDAFLANVLAAPKIWIKGDARELADLAE
jgi:DNA-binding transcriptional ArsR family regulator